MRRWGKWILVGLVGLTLALGVIEGIEIRNLVMKLLGYEGRQHYVVLLQNNMELWPTGGYMGSYAEFWTESGAIKDLKIEAIDVPSGQIKGYVAAPDPIVKYTHQGGTPGWRLRESNWEPDFPKASREIEWFFTEGGLEPIDTMVATNLIPIVEVLRVIGPITLLDYGVTVTADNFYQETQARVEMGFFDGSTQKRDFLGYLGRLMVEKIKNGNVNYLKLGQILINSLETKQIMIATKDATMGAWLKEKNWDGSLWPMANEDYVYVNEANLGINKTNCCIEREFNDEIEIATEAPQIKHQLMLKFVNRNPGTPKPPEAWGGGYQVYIRVYLPPNSEVGGITGLDREVRADSIIVEQREGKTIVGFLGEIGGGESGRYQLIYWVPTKSTKEPYELRIQKQSGVVSIPWNISVLKGNRTKTWQGQVDRDMTLSF